MTLTQTQSTFKRPLNLAPFQIPIDSLTPTRIAELDVLIASITIPQLQVLFQQGQLTSEELILYYLWRIQHFDEHRLNSVTEINPDALRIARQLDAERGAALSANHLRSPLHGTVVLLKDNIGTGDQMHTTAGARALQTAQADRDAFMVQKLREAGVVILGKTAMTEWANWVSDTMPDGFSAVGGQVRNAYGSGLSVSGSSTGSAAAVAANFASFAIGTETWGSLTSPAVAHGVVTLKPTLGLVSRDRIIPITDAQDTAGPFTRHVIDLALVMNAIAGFDASDEATRLANETSLDFYQGLTAHAARGLRIGLLPATPDNEALHQAVADALHAVGAIVVELPTLPNLSEDVVTAFFEICYYGFKTGVNRYLADTGAPITTLDEIVAFNQQDAADRIPYGQTYLENSTRTTLTPDTYAAAVQRVRDTAQQQIDELLATHSVDLLAGVNTALGSIVNYPGAGYPAIVLPIGFHASGKPAGMMLVGTALDDAMLIRAAYAIEQHLGPLPTPDLTHWR